MDLAIVNGFVWDGHSGRRRADVVVSGGRIKSVTTGAASQRSAGPPAAADAEVIDAGGATIIPGLIDGHSHVSFGNVRYPTQIEDTPPEETLMQTMHNARLLLDYGFTGLVCAGSPKLRSETVIRNEIDAGRIPGPRIFSSSATLTTTGGLNDSGQLHQQRDVSGMIGDSPDEFRRIVRLAYREGVDVIKVNFSGDDFFPRPPGRTTMMTGAEFEAITETARRLGLLVSVHARSAEAAKLSVRHGATIINHVDFADEEALDMLEEAKDRIFVAPTIGFFHGMLHDAIPMGFPESEIERMDLKRMTEIHVRVHTELRKRGIRAVIGGDYGTAWQPHGMNAADIDHFVTYYGYSPAEALRCATMHGAMLMGETGRIEEGARADLLVVAGDPTVDSKLVQDRANFVAVIRNGAIHSRSAARHASEAAAA